MRLCEVIEALARFDCGDTIYARKPWTAQSEAVVAREPDAGGLPAKAEQTGMAYFLEVAIAQEVIENLVALRPHPQTLSMICHRLIDYAGNDA